VILGQRRHGDLSPVRVRIGVLAVASVRSSQRRLLIMDPSRTIPSFDDGRSLTVGSCRSSGILCTLCAARSEGPQARPSCIRPAPGREPLGPIRTRAGCRRHCSGRWPPIPSKWPTEG